MTLCVAHRGGSYLAPENTLAAFEAGIVAGADWVECDVHESRDGALIVVHDARLERTTDRIGAVRSLSLQEIKKANAAARFRRLPFPPQSVPTFDELLGYLGGRVGLQVEIKVPDEQPYPDIERKVAHQLIAAAMTDTSLIISFDPSTLRRCRTCAPSLPTGLLISADHPPRGSGALGERIVEAARGCGASVAGLDVKLIEPDLVRGLQGAGISVAAWTVNDESTMRRCLSLGVDAIASDQPDLLRTVIDARA